MPALAGALSPIPNPFLQLVRSPLLRATPVSFMRAPEKPAGPSPLTPAWRRREEAHRVGPYGLSQGHILCLSARGCSFGSIKGNVKSKHLPRVAAGFFSARHSAPRSHVACARPVTVACVIQSGCAGSSGFASVVMPISFLEPVPRQFLSPEHPFPCLLPGSSQGMRSVEF